MSSFHLQDWLDHQLENNILDEGVTIDDFQDADIGGFGFPHYGRLEEPVFSITITDH